MKTGNDLGRDSVPSLVLKLAIPTMVAQFVNVLYSIIDRMYIGHIPEYGDLALAGAGICGPIVTLLSSFGTLVGLGGSIQMSIRMGERNMKKARQILSNSLLLLTLFSAVLTVLFLMIKGQLLRWFGASDQTFAYANTYLTIYTIGTFFALMAVGLNYFINCQGFPVIGMTTVLIGTVCNIILDPVFIFGLRMGISGAAAATVISQCVSFCILFFQCNFRKGCIRLRPGKFTPSLKIYGEILHAGLPSLCRQGLASAAAVALNVAANPFGDAAIAAMSIVTRYMMFINSALIGFGQGFQPVCGFNFGAKRYDRVLEAFWFCLKVAVILLTTLGVISFFGAEAIMGLFRKGDLEVIGIGTWAMRFQCLTLPFQAWIIMSNMLTQSIGYGFRASIVAAGRQGIFLIPALLTLPRFLGILGLQLCQPIADVCTSVMAAVIVVSILKELKVWNEEIQNLSKKTMDE